MASIPSQFRLGLLGCGYVSKHHVAASRSAGVPIVAVGGGGYNLTTVPRMWASACLELGGVPYDDQLPRDLAEAWGVATFSDAESPGGVGGAAADEVVDYLRRNHLPYL